MVLLPYFTIFQTSDVKYVDIPALCYLIVVNIFQGKNLPSTKSSASRLTGFLHLQEAKVVRERAVFTQGVEPGCYFSGRAVEGV